MYKAIMIDRVDGRHVASIRQIEDSSLSSGNVVVDVKYSTMNYKDGLLTAGARQLISKFPCHIERRGRADRRGCRRAQTTGLHRNRSDGDPGPYSPDLGAPQDPFGQDHAPHPAQNCRE